MCTQGRMQNAGFLPVVSIFYNASRFSDFCWFGRKIK
jgi:hypothetical protein